MTGFDDEVGYGKPPRWSQFRKGKSGNPKGRPRKARAQVEVPASSASDDMLRRELARRVRVKEGAKPIDLSMHEVILRSLTQTAAKGNPHAQREAIRLARELEQRDAERREAEDAEARSTFDAMVLYRRRRAEVWSEADQACGEPQQPWPHPDDVLLDEQRLTYRVRGPAHQGEVARFIYLRARRDEFLARSVHERRRRIYHAGAASHWDIWLGFDVLLPRRWQVAASSEEATSPLFLIDSIALDHHIAACAKLAAGLEAQANLQVRSKQVYQDANAALKPLLRRIGYRSLAQFERFCEEACGPSG